MALFLEVEPGDEVRIGESRVRIERKGGQRVRLRIQSEDDVEHVKPSDTTAQPAASILPTAEPFSRRPPSG